ncbi:MAG: hypothetical protein LBJ02_08875 [Bifidobacteriaceae bacterium]|jgi:hypothetical protein|nr:hypothetical protein [Bifidobacteriaceae bacterium]
MRKTITIIVAVTLALSGLSACRDEPEPGAGTAPPDASAGRATPTQPSGDPSPEVAATGCVLVASFLGGDPAGQEDEYPCALAGEDLNPGELAEALSGLTGLEFAIAYQNGDSAESFMIGWLGESSLITGQPPEPQDEEFRFFDADSLRWFMLDSLRATLMANFGDGIEVYYLSAEAGPLVLDGLVPVSEFPDDMAYQGSPFYFTHSGNR